jgi:hypothetical protein
MLGDPKDHNNYSFQGDDVTLLYWSQAANHILVAFPGTRITALMNFHGAPGRPIQISLFSTKYNRKPQPR